MYATTNRSKGKFEDTKGVIRIRISKKNRQHSGQKKKDKQRSKAKNIHIKLKIELHEQYYKSRADSGAPEREAVPAPLVVPIVLI